MSGELRLKARKKLLLVRIESTPDHTLGLIYLDGLQPFVTLEPPWKNNKPNVSCIPASECEPYICRVFHSPKHGRTFKIATPGRSDIEFHPLNYVAETEGCIGVGTFSNYSSVMQLRGIYESKNAFHELMQGLQYEEEIELQIVNACPIHSPLKNAAA